MIETTTIDMLAAPGANLHYEIRGSGPAVLMIHGGSGDAGGMERLADALSGRFTVISYDRRGYGRSPLTADLDTAPDDVSRVGIDADDAARLIEALAEGSAHVFGSSSGAIVALDLLTRHPTSVAVAVAHEPPLMTLLPDSADRLAFFDEVYATYRRDGVEAALRLFSAAIGLQPPNLPAGFQPPPQLARLLERMPANQVFFLDHELRQYTRYTADLAVLPTLPRLADRLILAGGADSREQFPYWPNQVLAEQLGLEVADFPGDHIGYMLHPAEFAARLTELLRPHPVGHPGKMAA